MTDKPASASPMSSPVDKYVWSLGLVAVGLSLLLTVALPGRFADADNWASMSVQLSEVGMFSLAMALALLIGGIDLSIVSVANLAALCSALSIRHVATALAPDAASSFPVAGMLALGLTVALGVGALVGWCNGLLIHRLGVPAILATLGSMTLVMGISLGITGGSSLSGLPEALTEFGNSDVGGVPLAFLVFMLVWLATWTVCQKTAFGTNMRLLGTSQRVAFFSGINNGKIIVRTHMATAMIAALGGFMNLLRTSSANPEYGQTYVLLALLVVVLGGISVTGGAGKMWGVLWALVILQLLSTGFNMLLVGVSDGNFFRDFVWGLLLLLAMALSAAMPRLTRHKPKP